MDDKVRSADRDRGVKSNKVVLFMKGNRSFPQCGFSATVVSILNPLVPKYETVNVLAEPAIRDGIKEYSQWPTIPQLYINGEFVGGCDIVKSLHASGELATLLGVKSELVTPPRITLSASAAKKAFKEAAGEAGAQVLRLEANERYQYELYFGDKTATDLVVESEGVAIHVPPASARLLDGTTVDFLEDEKGAGFKIQNPNEPARVKPLSPKGLKAMLDAGDKLELFDVRTTEERAIAAIPGARLLDPAGQEHLMSLGRDVPVVFHCHHGGRSAQAAAAFLQKGFKNVYNLKGGIDAWSQTVDPSVPPILNQLECLRIRLTSKVTCWWRFAPRWKRPSSDAARCEATGGNGHYSIVVTSPAFAGLNMVKSWQRLVYAAIAHLLKGDQPPIHAVDSLQTVILATQRPSGGRGPVGTGGEGGGEGGGGGRGHHQWGGGGGGGTRWGGGGGRTWGEEGGGGGDGNGVGGGGRAQGDGQGPAGRGLGAMWKGAAAAGGVGGLGGWVWGGCRGVGVDRAGEGGGVGGGGWVGWEGGLSMR